MQEDGSVHKYRLRLHAWHHVTGPVLYQGSFSSVNRRPFGASTQRSSRARRRDGPVLHCAGSIWGSSAGNPIVRGAGGDARFGVSLAGQTTKNPFISYVGIVMGAFTRTSENQFAVSVIASLSFGHGRFASTSRKGQAVRSCPGTRFQVNQGTRSNPQYIQNTYLHT